LKLALSLEQTQWLMYEQRSLTVSRPMLAVMIFWLMAVFLSISIFAPRNTMVAGNSFIAALAVSGAVLLILEMYSPYAGRIRISGAPLEAALAQLGR